MLRVLYFLDFQEKLMAKSFLTAVLNSSLFAKCYFKVTWILVIFSLRIYQCQIQFSIEFEGSVCRFL